VYYTEKFRLMIAVFFQTIWVS